MKLELFMFDTCPYCQRVMGAIAESGRTDIVYHDITESESERLFLVENGGKEYSVEIACLNGLEVDLLFRYTIGGSNDVKRFFAPRLLSLALNALEEPEEELYE